MSTSRDLPEMEPIAGLPASPPEGEEILWQGKPNWWGLAIRVFHIKKAAVYFAILIVWYAATALFDGAGIAAAAGAVGEMLLLAAIGLGLLAGLAKLYARTTIYTITTRRVVMRFGVALSMAVNFPFSKIDGAAIRLCSDGTGDIPLSLRGPDKIAWLHLWPFARPGRYRRPEPMMRALPDAMAVADLLGAAMKTELREGVVHTIATEPDGTPVAASAKAGLAVSTR